MYLFYNQTGNVSNNDTSRRFHANGLQWQNNKHYIFWVCVRRLRYPERNAHASYCHPRPVRLYNIFPHFLINRSIFENTFLNIKCVFWFSLQILSETFLILRRIERDVVKKVNCLHVKYSLFLSDCNEIEVSRQSF